MGTNLMHWLFAFKYWIIAREVPKLFDQHTIEFNERSYRTMNMVGVIINIIPCFMIAYFRA